MESAASVGVGVSLPTPWSREGSTGKDPGSSAVTNSPQGGVKSPVSGLGFVLALAGIRQRVVQIKATWKDNLLLLRGLVVPCVMAVAVAPVQERPPLAVVGPLHPGPMR